MTARRLRKDWDEFWGTLLMLRWHQDDPARWSRREQRADWLVANLRLSPGSRILDLGCGDGILDICLAQRGLKVTGVDRMASVLPTARGEPGAEKVEYLHDDIREVSFPDASYDAVLMIELVGLMGKDEDARLLLRANSWLAEHGVLVLDCALAPSMTEGESRHQFEDGLLEYRWIYDAVTHLQCIIPEYHAGTGEVIELHDPYDRSRPDHVGVLRYLYPKDELTRMVLGAGFRIREVASQWRSGFYLLVGEA